MKFVYDDGGRSAAGFKGNAGDCVTRAVAIATGRPYHEVYQALAVVNANARCRYAVSKRGVKSARNGVSTSSVGFKRYMASLGWKWTPTMGIGTGCRVHLHDGELPMGRLVVAVSRHYTAVIDGVIHDTYSPAREVHCVEPDRSQDLKPGQWRLSNGGGIAFIQRRCVYGYWQKDFERVTMHHSLTK